MLGSLILYLKGLRIMVFQLSGFYCICMDPNTPRFQRFSGQAVQLLLLLLLYRHVDVRGFAAALDFGQHCLELRFVYKPQEYARDR